MPTDADLLHRYVKARDERAFAELVRRHLNLVYTVALRRTNGRSHVAEEIAQRVFTDLARKAAALQHHPALTGWLHRSTRYAAIDAARWEKRHQRLTQTYSAMVDDPMHPENQTDWNNLRPVIDDAMDELKEKDREVMLLRYFDGLSFAEVGARMSLSENAARMRTERALEKLRTQLGKRGVTSTATALNLLLANQTWATVPASLASSVTMAALATAPVGTIASLLGRLAMNKMAAVGIGTGLTMGIVGLAWSISIAQVSRDELTFLRAENSRLAQVIAALGNEPLTGATTVEVTAPTLLAGPLFEVQAAEKPALENGDHRNCGQATAGDALLSYAWALDTGNAAALSKLITFDEAGREALEGHYARLPESIRVRYRTPHDLVVHVRLVSAVLSPPPNVEQLKRFVATEVGPARVVLRKAGTKGYGWPVVRTAEGWKVELPVKGLDGAVKKLLSNEIVVQLGIN